MAETSDGWAEHVRQQREQHGETASELSELLGSVYDLSFDIGQDRSWTPKAGSTEDLDQKDSRYGATEDIDPVRWGFAPAALLQLTAGRDQLLALSRLLQPPPAVFATATIARAAIEASARANWLLDTKTTRTERAARRARELMEELRRMALGGDDDSAANLEHLATWCEKAGIATKRDRNGWLSKIGDTRPPKLNELVRHLSGGVEGLVHIWGAYAQITHGRITGLAPYVTLDSSLDDSQTGVWSHNLGWWQAWLMTGATALAHLTAVEQLTTVAGWANAHFRRIHDGLQVSAVELLQRALRAKPNGT